jgi:hypothetical protein
LLPALQEEPELPSPDKVFPQRLRKPLKGENWVSWLVILGVESSRELLVLLGLLQMEEGKSSLLLFQLVLGDWGGRSSKLHGLLVAG